MNKYLEKIALNASKAREMAKQVGIIPDHQSAWKWALRNLRGKSGEALTKEKRRMGDLTNNAYQKFSKLDKKEGVKGYEFTGHVEDTGKIREYLERGLEPGGISPGRYRMQDINIHSHPPGSSLTRSGMTKDKFLKTREFQNSHLPSRPSGDYLLSDFRNHTSLRHSKYPMDLSIAQEKQRKLGKISSELESNYDYDIGRAVRKSSATVESLEPLIKKRDSILERSSKLSSLIDENLKRKHPKDEIPGADTLGFILLKDRHHRIVSPSINTVSAHKVRPNGLRSVYFDHTPRKLRNE